MHQYFCFFSIYCSNGACPLGEAMCAHSTLAAIASGCLNAHVRAASPSGHLPLLQYFKPFFHSYSNSY